MVSTPFIFCTIGYLELLLDGLHLCAQLGDFAVLGMFGGLVVV
jgi:hypothetical protein